MIKNLLSGLILRICARKNCVRKYECEVNFLIENFNSEELALLRNTIYAKYNRRFQTPKYSSYFSRKTWYRGEYNEVSERNFSQDEFDLLNNILMAEGKSTLSR